MLVIGISFSVSMKLSFPKALICESHSQPQVRAMLDASRSTEHGRTKWRP